MVGASRGRNRMWGKIGPVMGGEVPLWFCSLYHTRDYLSPMANMGAFTIWNTGGYEKRWRVISDGEPRRKGGPQKPVPRLM